MNPTLMQTKNTEPSTTQDLSSSLERMRRRLLDLSLRNRLLNFPLVENGPRLLRLVDALPDVLYVTLVDEAKALPFVPVPMPEEYGNVKRLSGGEGHHKPREEGRGEEDVISPEEYADFLGIDTHYTVTEPEEKAEAALLEKLQTLHYSPELETRLRRIRHAARTHAEESGSNALHLMFGMLEWEDESGEQRYHAPLFSLPAHLRKGELVQEGPVSYYRYFLEASGEPVLANLPLKEKLRQQYDILLPDIEEEETPESYLKRVQDVISEHPACQGWKVCRYLTLGLLPFGQFRLYQDTDPAVWNGKSLSRHPVLSVLLAGDAVRVETLPLFLALENATPEVEPEKTSAPGKVAETDAEKDTAVSHPVPVGTHHFSGDTKESGTTAISARSPEDVNPSDEGPMLAFQPEDAVASEACDLPLVLDADSSQIAALKAALDGKNLVIQGPPGTGKSQTITNLIALAMAEGKTVLFASEKNAALEVVKRRLEACGLGDFCLGLHSHKAKRRLLLADIDARLKYAAPKADDAKIKDTLKERGQLQENLERYMALINQPAEGIALRETPREMIWKAEAFRLRLKDAAPPLQGVSFPAAGKTDARGYERLHDTVRRLASHYRALDNTLGDKENPWRGLQLKGSVAPSADQFRQALGDMAHASRSLVEKLDEFERHSALHLPREIESLRALSASVPNIPAPGDRVVPILTRLDNIEQMDLLQQFYVYRQESAKLAENAAWLAPVMEQIEMSQANRLETALRMLEERGFHEGALPDIEAAVSELKSLRMALDKLTETLESLRSSLPEFTTSDPAFRDVQALVVFAKLAHEAPLDLLSMRQLKYTRKDVQEQFSILYRMAEDLQDKERELGAKVTLGSLPDEHIRRFCIRQFSQTGAFRRFNSDWRKADRQFRDMLVDDAAWEDEDKLELLEEIATYLKLKEDFAQRREDHRELFDSRVEWTGKGLAKIKRLMDWYAEIIATAEMNHEGLFEKLYSADSKRLLTYATYRLKLQKYIKQVQDAEQHLVAYNMTARHAGTSIKEYRDRVEDALKGLQEDQECLQELQPDRGLSLARIREQTAGLPDILAQRDAVRAHESELYPIFQYPDSLDSVPLDLIVSLREWMDILRKADLPVGVLPWLLDRDAADRLQRLKRLAADAERELAQLDAGERQLHALAEVDISAWFRTTRDRLTCDTIVEQAEYALGYADLLIPWADICLIKQQLNELELGALVEVLEKQRISTDHYGDAFALVFYQSLVRQLFNALSEFRQSNAAELEKHIADMERLERLLIEQLHREMLAERIAAREVPEGKVGQQTRDYTELKLLQHEIRKSRRHLPIRQLMSRSGNALQALKPCFMMGPQSVAQYLEPGQLSFDLVIIDEASQMRTEEAIGLIARGSQLVVVGDSRQLPPSPFFQRFGFQETRGEAESGSIESILNRAATQFTDVVHLAWHYRSRHHSLIQFSNRKFYENSLTVFPSPDGQTPDRGVVWNPVTDGLYTERRNMPEARAVARAAAARMKAAPGESLGIVALNQRQCEAIEAEVEFLFKKDGAARAYEQRWQTGEEPFFIKTIEQVQGDERDAILISMTYGRDKAGRLFRRFGPVSTEQGWRRLNVLFTRARRLMQVFSSMTPEDISLEGRPSVGTRILREFLEYARTGDASANVEASGKGGYLSDSGEWVDTPSHGIAAFHITIASLLAHHGYHVEPRWGVAGHHLDLVVHCPASSHRFILAIEGDGREPDARHVRIGDADWRVRHVLLRQLGWTIYRIWTVDWFRNAAREEQRLLEALRRQTVQAPESQKTEEAVPETSELSVSGAIVLPAPSSASVARTAAGR